MQQFSSFSVSRLGWWCPQRSPRMSRSPPWTCCRAPPASWSPGPAQARVSQRQSPRHREPQPPPLWRSFTPSSGRCQPPGCRWWWGGPAVPRPRPPTPSPWPPVATPRHPRRRPWTSPSERGVWVRAAMGRHLTSMPTPWGSTRLLWQEHHSHPRHHYHPQYHHHPLLTTFQSTQLLHTTDLLLTQGPPHLHHLPLQRLGHLLLLTRLLWPPSRPHLECRWPRPHPPSWPWPRGRRPQR